MIEVKTQAQLEKALKKTGNGRDELIYCIGGGHFTLWENSTATLRENSTARAWDRSAVDAAKQSVVLQHSPAARIKGGRILEMPRPETGAEWCEFYGVEIRKGGGLDRKLAGQDVAILFKALGPDFISSYRCAYTPGTCPSAPDWDGGEEECGGGLHFSPHPLMAEEFHEQADHFVACPVLVSEIVVHPDGVYPQKVKAPRVCAPCWEVDKDGKKVGRVLMLAALVNTATDLAVGLLLAASVASLLFAAGVFLGRCIHGAETPELNPSNEPKDAGDLDDWLAQVGPLEEFNLWKRPKSEAELERRPV